MGIRWTEGTEIDVKPKMLLCVAMVTETVFSLY